MGREPVYDNLYIREQQRCNNVLHEYRIVSPVKMLKTVILLVVLVLCVYAGGSVCGARRPCKPRTSCICCPPLRRPSSRVIPGCADRKVVDKQTGCPVMKTFCGNL
ncbi:hypothetical protein Y032_0102g3503 [Ancylostoma ceylanicum]|uniref:Uncharacterized protein n=1 Tax=Ancylostoma ceylanicum TaxID=53326 RepID=A0A016TGQ4_9BILA|nr:hypothetical protein Y032_0102g3503 [Ancylostoma ceylanicum]